MSGWWGSKALDEQIAKATAESLPTGAEDMFLSLEISDQVRSKAVAPKEAMRALKRRINHKNPNVQLAALKLTDTCVKNGGDHFLIEVASREFMDNFVSLLKASGGINPDVRNKILEYIQIWSLAFEGRPHLSYTKTIYNKLQSEGFQFPELTAPVNASYVDSSAPPEWADSDRCMRCHTQFTMTNRKHHCRNCGNVYCGDCSSKTMALPHLGITQPVRVCETCYDERNSAKLKSPVISPPASATRTMQPRSARVEDDDDKQLKLALQMSLEEAKRLGIDTSSTSSRHEPPKPTPQSSTSRRVEEQEDEDLKAAIAASLKDIEPKKAVEYPSVQPITSTVVPPATTTTVSNQYQVPVPNPNNELSPVEADNITLFATFIERMQSSPPGAILREPKIQELYEAVSALKPKLARTLSTVVGTYESLVDMHAKLNTVVRYYDKMLEDRLATTYSQATYQEARPPPQSTQTYQYSPPPQSPASPSHAKGYFPPRNSISDPNAPPVQVPPDMPSYYSPPQQLPPNWGYSNYPPAASPAVGKSSHPQPYVDPSYPYGQSGPPREQPPTNQSAYSQEAPYQGQGSYQTYSGQNGYYQQSQPLQRREETSLIDL